MLDKEGYRPNVGIILANQRNDVFWGKRVNQHAWQFPQGGINYGETRAGVERPVPRPEADLVPAAHDRPRLRRQAARQRPSRVRRLALARILGAARGGDRVQARGVPPGADRAASLPADGPPRAAATRAAGGLGRMERIYQALPLRELGSDAGFRRPGQPSSERVTLESPARSEEHTSELQSPCNLVCRLLLEKKKKK